MGDHDIYPSLHDVYLDADADEIDSVVDSENVICMQAMIYALLSRAEKAASELERVQAENARLRGIIDRAYVALEISEGADIFDGCDHARAVLSSVVPKEETP